MATITALDGAKIADAVYSFHLVPPLRGWNAYLIKIIDSASGAE